MNDILKNSFFVKTVSKLGVYYKSSAIYSLSVFFRNSYKKSKTKTVLDKFCETQNSAPGSAYGRFCAFLSAKCAALEPAVAGSVFLRSADSALSTLRKAAENSKIAPLARRCTLRRLLIVGLVFTVCVDYFFRNVITVTFIASVWDEFLIVAALAYLVARRASTRIPKSCRVTPIDGYLILFLAVGFFLMCAVSPYLSIAVAGYRAVCEYMLWFFLMIRLCENDGDMKTFFFSMVFLSLLMALHGIYQYVVAVPIPASWVSQTESGVRTRVFSIIGSPNILGSFFVLTAPMAAGLAYYFKDMRLKIASWCIVFLMCLSLLFTFSRGAWIGMAVAVLIFAVFVDRRLIVLMMTGAFGALLFVPSISNRITYLFTSDYVAASLRGGRMVRWDTAKQLLLDSNRFLGFGLGRFGGAVAMQNKILEETDTFKYFYVDNYYLKTEVEMGYIGLFFFTLLLAGLLIWSFRSVGRIKGDRTAFLGWAMLAGMCGVLVHCYFENIFEVPYMVSYFWSMGAVIFYLGYFRNARRDPSQCCRK
ncbi:MAG: O-antigen ligase family protein [Bacillota bacterium]|nr:O-antigen ligase family protein [Bacillota bacterium]